MNPRTLFDKTFPPAPAARPAFPDWEVLHGRTLPPAMRRWLIAGGIELASTGEFEHSWLRLPSETGDAPIDIRATNAFASRVVQVQRRERSLLGLFDPFAGLLPLAERDDWYLAAQAVTPGQWKIVGFEQRHEDPLLDGTLAEDIVAFVGMRHLYDAGAWRREALQCPDADHLALLRSLSGRVRFEFPFAELTPLAELASFEPLPEQTAGPELVQRSRWIVHLLRDGPRALEEHWEVNRLAEMDSTPLVNYMTALEQPDHAPSALYWLWRLFLLGRLDLLDGLTVRSRESASRWVRDAARLLANAQKKQTPLGSIESLSSFAERFRRLVPQSRRLAK